MKGRFKVLRYVLPLPSLVTLTLTSIVVVPTRYNSFRQHLAHDVRSQWCLPPFIAERHLFIFVSVIKQVHCVRNLLWRIVYVDVTVHRAVAKCVSEMFAKELVVYDIGREVTREECRNVGFDLPKDYNSSIILWRNEHEYEESRRYHSPRCPLQTCCVRTNRLKYGSCRRCSGKCQSVPTRIHLPS